jgi:hypothetical protein
MRQQHGLLWHYEFSNFVEFRRITRPFLLVCGIRYELDIIHNMKISMTCVLAVFSQCALHTCMRCMTKLEMCRETNQ